MTPGSFDWLNHLVKHEAKRLKPTDLAVAMVLLKFADSSGHCCPSSSTIADLLNINRGTVFRSLHKLEAIGILHRWREGRAPQYQLTIPEDAGEADGPLMAPGRASATPRGAPAHPIDAPARLNKVAPAQSKSRASANERFKGRKESVKESIPPTPQGGEEAGRGFVGGVHPAVAYGIDPSEIEIVYTAMPLTWRRSPRTERTAIRAALATLYERGEPSPVAYLRDRVCQFAKSDEFKCPRYRRNAADWFDQEAYDADPSTWVTRDTAEKTKAEDPRKALEAHVQREYEEEQARMRRRSSLSPSDGPGRPETPLDDETQHRPF